MDVRLPHLAPSPHLDLAPSPTKGLYSRKATVISPIHEDYDDDNISHMINTHSRRNSESRGQQMYKEREKLKSRDESRNQRSRALSRNLSRASFKAPTRMGNRSKTNVETPIYEFDPEADYDFDFESDEDETPANFSNTIEVYKTTYLSNCKKLKVRPCSKVLLQFGKEHMSFCGLNLTKKEMKAVFITILNNVDIESVDISNNHLSVKEIGYTIDILRANKIIHTLVLQDCKLSGKPIEMLADFLKKSTVLQYLDLSYNGLNDNDAISVAEIIEQNESVRKLILAHNKLGECGAILGTALIENETLKELDLSWNHIRSKGAVGVALGLKKNIALLKLSLSWNGFGFEGSVALACALATNTTLTHLDLACNRIHPPALFELIKGLATNKSLRVLCLSHNPITAPMTSILLDRIKNFKQTQLAELDLKGVVVDKFFADILSEIREKRPMFTVYYDMALPVNKTAATTYDPTNIFNIDPIRILYFMKEHMRTIDLFLKLDKDGSNSLTRDEMLYAFEREGYPISEDALDTVMGYLDTNKDGSIDLLERWRKKSQKLELHSMTNMDNDHIPVFSTKSIIQKIRNRGIRNQDKTGTKANKQKPPPYEKKRTLDMRVRPGAQEE
ncbi:hypothetical protein FSP39_001818 [Pinctada imbricata]|uniref:EF-hand domain-containing protein n=1 Tax=Pinctada imbricata TaxID=66713 RepID=A0AA88Y6C1_PINIB|nr:hypothetical protein FSP39_001818 [Pinctada imbricata]